VSITNRAPPNLRLDKVRDIAAGGRHNVALRKDDSDHNGTVDNNDISTVWAWGDNKFSQAGKANPSTANLGSSLQSFALQVAGLSDVIEIAAGDDFSLALKSDGTVWAWGANTRGQLGATSTHTCGPTQARCSFTPIQVGGLTGVRHIAAGGQHALALATG
jgi:alpha-tubulin suppressor-like RCC1 family protein